MPLTLPLDELGSWIRLSLEPGLGPAQARSLLAATGLPQDVYASSIGQLMKLLPLPVAQQLKSPPAAEILAAIEATLKWLDHPRHHLLTLADPAYPPLLFDTHDPPLLLYVNGALPLLSQPGIAVVGARSATVAGTDNARAFSRYLAEHGWCITSGLALGIDAAAHEGALAAGPAGGRTIAVLGTGIDIVYPARNRDLAHRIAAEGALVSEFPLGKRALHYHFPKRNRLVAGLSRGVLVVEAARQSGSLITARLASEMGREVFAIPGSIHSPLSRGCHVLIRQGAKLVESGQDIHEELGTPRPASIARPEARTAPLPADPLGGDAKRVLDALGHDPAHIDLLAQRTGMDLPGLNACLLNLEFTERIFRHEDGRFQRRQTEVAPATQTLYDDRQP